MLLHLIFLAMAVAAALAVLMPLARARAGGAPAGGATLGPATLHRLRLAEIDRDLDRGLLDRVGAEAARNEAARILLRAADSEARAGEAAVSAEDRGSTLLRRRGAALAAVIALPAFAFGLYALLGSPELPSQPFAARAATAPDAADINALIGQVEAHLAAHPDDGKGYEVIAPVYMRLGRYDDAVRARAEALRLLGETPDRLADLAEARVAAAGGVVTKDAAAAIARALALDPKHPKARFLQAIGYAQDGRRDEAVAVLKALLADAPPDAPWRQVVAARLASLVALAPSASPEAADDPAIRAMVEGLAARLKAQGGTAEEWARLVRSYAVLGEADKARETLAAARAAHPDAASLAMLTQVARAAGIEAAP